MDLHDPFAPIDPGEINGAGPPGGRYTDIEMPAPTEPPTVIKHRQYGTAVRQWVYRTAAGQPLLAVARFELSSASVGQRKVVLPMAYMVNGKTGWQFGVPDDCRPLYGLDRLAEDPTAPVIVTEGEKAADAATAIFLDHVAVTSQGGAQASAKTDWSPLKGRHVVVWPDQDNDGRVYAKAVAAKLKSIGALSVHTVNVPDTWPAKWDLADKLPDGISVETLMEMVAPPPDPHALSVLTPAQCEDGDPRPYVIKGLIARGDHAQFIGLPGSGKSALAPLAGYCIALGIPFLGRRVRQGTVLYLAAEDGHGMKLRTRALRKRLGDTPHFLLMPDGINLFDPGSGDFERVTKLIQRHKPVAVFLDTVSRAFPGLKENDPDAMGRVVSVARALAAMECRPAIITVHHVAKDGGITPRGHGVLAGDLDIIVLVQGEKADLRSVVLGKNRNGASDASFAFNIEVEDFGEDEDGDLITAPIAAPIEPTASSRKSEAEAKLADKPATMLREVRDLIDRQGEALTPAPNYPVTRAVTRNSVQSRLIDRGWFPENLLCVDPDGKTKLTRQGFAPEHNALTTLKRKGLLSFNRSYVWLL